jgi:hypothetical protein
MHISSQSPLKALQTALVPCAADPSVLGIEATLCITNISWREKLSSDTPKKRG